MILNVLRPCRINLRISAYISLEGEFTHSNTLLVLLSSQIIASITPVQ